MCPATEDPADSPRATTSDLHRQRIATAVIWTVVIMVLCWMPGSMVNKIENGSSWYKLPNFDKLVHGGIFVVFSILYARLGTSRRRFVWIAVGGIALAVITELVQKLAIVGRDGTLGDGAVDIAGILIGFVAAPMVEPLARLVEGRLSRKPVVRPVPAKGPTIAVKGVARPSH